MAPDKQVLTRHRWAIFVTGPTACGKTTIAKYVADKLNIDYLEGDDFHPKANVEKMSRGEPLTDADRWNWLHALRDHESMHPPGEKSHDLIITCSALKRQYRDVLREGVDKSPNLRIRFIYLDAPESVLADRAASRQGHFAKANLVHSQFQSLERPQKDEEDVYTVRVDRPVEEAEEDALGYIRGLLDGDLE